MKRKYCALPESMSKMEMYGFHWMEFVAQIPSPLFIITSYKNNGLPALLILNAGLSGKRKLSRKMIMF